MLESFPPGFQQKTVKTTLGSMVYYTSLEPTSSTHPPLVFLHNFGGGASAYEWSRIFPALAGEYPLFAADLIGWGASAHPVRDYQVEDYLLTLKEFFHTIAQQPVIAIASSLTGAIVVRLAIQHPQLFHHLYLVCPSGFADFGQDAGRRLPLQAIGLPLLDRLIYTLGATTDLAVRNFLERFLFARPERIDTALVNAYLASATQPNAEYAALAFLRGDLYFDLANYLPQLQVPTVIFWGECAQFTPLSLGQRLAQLNPQAIRDFQTIPETGILPHLELPGVFFRNVVTLSVLSNTLNAKISTKVHRSRILPQLDDRLREFIP